MGTVIRYHILNLAVGDRFAFWPDGPIFRIVGRPTEGGVWIVDDAGKLPAHKLDYAGTFVHPIDNDEEGDDE